MTTAGIPSIFKHTGVRDNAAGIVFGEWTELDKLKTF